MCGITGIINLDRTLIDNKLLVRMTRKLIHRGPDEEGYFVNAGRLGGRETESLDAHIRTLDNNTGNMKNARGNVGLGHRRLSIIDLASGQQPLCNEDGTIWIVFNGEIYNFKALKSDLENKGHIFRTHSDTEAIVHAYEEWEEKAIERLRGMFALAIWDEKKRTLILARDRLGKKPLYYLADGKRFLFASEIKAILEAPNVPRDIDLEALSDYFSLLYIPSPKTIFKSIRKIPAAHYAVVSPGSLKVLPYWDLAFQPVHTYSESRIIEDLLGILDESTKIRMISEVPLGAFLSGGIDSSAVVALMANASQDAVITNSISFSVDRYNEAQHAKHVSELFSTDHHEFKVTPEAVPVIEKLTWHYDEPFADSSAVPTYYVSKTARENVTVALSGDGGDENFAGYRRYYFDMRENYVRNFVPAGLRRQLFGTIGKIYPKADYLPQIFRGKAFISNIARDPVDAYYFSVSACQDDEKALLLNQEVKSDMRDYRTVDLFYKTYKKADAADHLSRIQYLDVKTYLCEDILTKVDRASMAVSLEVRCPLLDHVFMEYVAGIPSELKLRGTDGKHIFKKGLTKYLPNKILYRKKMGFGVPIKEWMRNDLKEYAHKWVLRGEASDLYLDKTHLKKIWNEHQNAVRDRSTELWSVMMLNLWHNRFITEHSV